jgi:hypothetical protein
MSTILKTILILLSCCPLLSAAQGQSSDKRQVMEAMTRLSNRYKNFKRLSFTIAYKYASEDRPGQYLDSLKGSITVSGNRYWYSIDSTEYIGGSDLSVILFKQDKIMYLVRPSATQRSANPLAMLDSFLTRNDSVDCRLTETGGLETITMTFKPGMASKRVEYCIDRNSGLLIKMINVVPSKELYSSSAKPLVKGNSSYAIVETEFRDYREASGEELPDPGRYCKKQGDRYVTIAPYESYKIFLGTPDL